TRCRSTSALLDESLCHRCWRRRILRSRPDPMLGLLKGWRSQQQAARPPSSFPAPRALPELGVLPDPVDVGLKSLCQSLDPFVEACVDEVDAMYAGDSGGHHSVGHGPANDRCESLVEGSREVDLLLALRGSYRVGAENEYNRVGLDDQR